MSRGLNLVFEQEMAPLVDNSFLPMAEGISRLLEAFDAFQVPDFQKLERVG